MAISSRISSPPATSATSSPTSGRCSPWRSARPSSSSSWGSTSSGCDHGLRQRCRRARYVDRRRPEPARRAARSGVRCSARPAASSPGSRYAVAAANRAMLAVGCLIGAPQRLFHRPLQDAGLHGDAGLADVVRVGRDLAHPIAEHRQPAGRTSAVSAPATSSRSISARRSRRRSSAATSFPSSPIRW